MGFEGKQEFEKINILALKPHFQLSCKLLLLLEIAISLLFGVVRFS